MTDGQVFLFVFVAIYLADCLTWLTARGTALLSPWNRTWYPRRPLPLLDARKGGITFSMPLPPLGSRFAVAPWPLALSEDGISTLTLDHPNPGSGLRGPGHAIGWDAIDEIARDGRKLFINGKLFAKLSSPPEADHFARLIARLRAAPASQRRTRIRQVLLRHLDDRHLKERVELFLRATRVTALLANTLFVAGFIALPLGYVFLGATRPFWSIVLLVVCLMISLAMEYFQWHRRFFPRLRAERWQHFFIILLVPQIAIRARDALARDYLFRSHPLAAARALASPGLFRDLAGTAVRDLRHPLPLGLETGGSSLINSVATGYHEHALTPALTQMLARWDLDEKTLVKPALDSEAFAHGTTPKSYCPRCHVPFLIDEAECPDCDHLRSLPIPAGPGSGSP